MESHFMTRKRGFLYFFSYFLLWASLFFFFFLFLKLWHTLSLNVKHAYHEQKWDNICVWDRYLWPSLTQGHSTENRRHCTNKLVREMNLHSIAPTVGSLVDKAVANLSPALFRYLSPDSNQDFKGIFSAEHLLIWKFVTTQPFFI